MSASDSDVLTVLSRGEMGGCRLVPAGSNDTFVTWVSLDGRRCRTIYKPRDGEAPLWDFPEGTLYRREYASYVLSQALGWGLVPPTVVRPGPYGVGSVQLFIPPAGGSNYFMVRESHAQEVQRMAVFDVVANNADRKAGHCFQDTDGRVWGIDHGLTFHQVPKLRTVIWDFAGDRVPEVLLADLAALARELEDRTPRVAPLWELLEPAEVEALRLRTEDVLRVRRFPQPLSYQAFPWPMM